MESKYVKTKIIKLLGRQMGTDIEARRTVARLLHISPRYVLMLASGKQKAGFHLAEAIDRLLEDRK